MKHLFLATTGFLLCWTVSFEAGSVDSPVYTGKPLAATIVDADTGAPIEGAAVVVEWGLEYFNGHLHGRWFDVESVTDSNGKFAVPGWGPTATPKFHGYPTRLPPYEPGIFILKSGYTFTVVQGPYESYQISLPQWTGDLVRESWWNEKTIKVKPFHGSDREYFEHLAQRISSVPLLACGWITLPRMAAVFINEDKRIGSQILGYRPFSLRHFESDSESFHCGQSPTTLLAPYLK